MKKIGIVGGIGWPSTLEYYKLICEESLSYHKEKQYVGPCPMPEISIESLNMNFIFSNRGSHEPVSWTIWNQYFHNALLQLESSGCEVLLMASVTPHARLKDIVGGLTAPLLSVYTAVGDECKKMGMNNLLVLGTSQTMGSPAFVSEMKSIGVVAMYPSTADLKNKIAEVISLLYENKSEGMEKVINKIVRVCITPEDLKHTAVCLACTELPLAFSQYSSEPHFSINGIHYINSTVVHARAAFMACIE